MLLGEGARDVQAKPQVPARSLGRAPKWFGGTFECRIVKARPVIANGKLARARARVCAAAWTVATGVFARWACRRFAAELAAERERRL